MDWFIIKEDGHLGPFNSEQLHILVKSAKIKADTQVWTDSMSEPKSYQEVFYTKKMNPIKHKVETPLITKSPVKKVKIQKKRSYKFIITMLLLISSVIVIQEYVKTIKYSFSRPNKMSISTFKRLEEVALKDNSKIHYDIAMSKDRSQIWFVTNNIAQKEIEVIFESIEGKVLSNEQVKFTSNAKFKNHLATFETLEFIKGSRIIEGYYFVKIFSKNQKNTNLLYEQTFLVSSSGEQKFIKKLEDFLKENKQNEHNFWSELSQKYETIKMLTLQINEDLIKVASSPSKRNIDKFQKSYQKKYGPFFTSFVISNELSFNQLKDKTFSDKVEVIASYTELSKLARSIGSLTMEALDEFQNSKNNFSFEESFDHIIKLCDQKIKQLEDI